MPTHLPQVLPSYSVQPPHVWTRQRHCASSAARGQETGKLKSWDTKQVAGEWKNKRWLPLSGRQGTCCMSSQCLSTQWCGDDVPGRASSKQSQGHRVDGKLNAPTVCCPQTNTIYGWMNAGNRDQRVMTSELPCHLSRELFKLVFPTHKLSAIAVYWS